MECHRLLYLNLTGCQTIQLPALNKMGNTIIFRQIRFQSLLKNLPTIVNGSNAGKPSQVPINKAYQKKTDELKGQNDTRRTSSMPETSSPMISGDGQEPGRRKPQQAVDNETSASVDVRRSSDSAALSVTEQELPDSSFCIKKEGSEGKLGNPLKQMAEKKQVEQDVTHICRSDDVRVQLASMKSHQYHNNHHHPHQQQRPHGIERPD
jgi:thiol:disulfide interchange protein